MPSRLFVYALALLPLIASAGTCTVPEFERFSPGKNNERLSDRIEIEMQPVAALAIPAGFSRIGAMPDGSIGFGQHPKKISAVLGFETTQTVSLHEEGAKPGPFFLSVFKGLSAVGCNYLMGYQLEAEDYRLHATLARNAELFAYGRENEHHFYLIHPDKPDLVLNGFFRNINRAEFEAILSTLVLN